MGDSGIFSRSGVELPLVGGPPQGFSGIPGTPSWAWISRALLENSLPDPDKSCEGEPAPDRVVPAILLPVGLSVPDMPNGDLTADAPDDSMGDCDLAELVVVVGEAERPWLVAGWPKLRYSDLALDIIDYSSDLHSEMPPLYDGGAPECWSRDDEY